MTKFLCALDWRPAGWMRNHAHRLGPVGQGKGAFRAPWCFQPYLVVEGQGASAVQGQGLSWRIVLQSVLAIKKKAPQVRGRGGAEELTAWTEQAGGGARICAAPLAGRPAATLGT